MERLAGLRWRKSTHSGSNGGGCIETASHDSRVIVRDTQDRTGPVLRFDVAAWRQFTGRVKDPQT
jgi:Domain of unknown function (DUF397)